jgi:hypothetical protein
MYYIEKVPVEKLSRETFKQMRSLKAAIKELYPFAKRDIEPLKEKLRSFRRYIRLQRLQYSHRLYHKKGTEAYGAEFNLASGELFRAMRETKQGVKDYREDRRQLRTKSKRVYYKGRSYNFEAKPNQGIVKQFMNHLEKQRIKENKQPSKKVPYVSIEFELVTNLSYEEITEMLCNAELGKYVTVKHDGSINTEEYDYAHEVVLTCESNLVRKLTTDLLDILGPHCAVNKSCGTHVHLDMREVTGRCVSTAYNNLMSVQKWLCLTQPQSRVAGQYCRQGRGKDFDKAMNRRTPNRYRVVNPHAYDKYSTLEVRVHSGTLNAAKILNWVSLLEGIALSPRILRCPRTFKQVGDIAGLTEAQTKYFLDRISKFSHTFNEENEVA